MYFSEWLLFNLPIIYDIANDLIVCHIYSTTLCKNCGGEVHVVFYNQSRTVTFLIFEQISPDAKCWKKRIFFKRLRRTLHLTYNVLSRLKTCATNVSGHHKKKQSESSWFLQNLRSCLGGVPPSPSTDYAWLRPPPTKR
jgi:hypothetical protein